MKYSLHVDQPPKGRSPWKTVNGQGSSPTVLTADCRADLERIYVAAAEAQAAEAAEDLARLSGRSILLVLIVAAALMFAETWVGSAPNCSH